MSKDPSGSAAINYTVETPKVHTFFFRSNFFRSKIFRRENFRPHIPIPNFLKIPKITLRKLCDEAWCPKTKYIIPKPWIYTVVNCLLFPGICPHRKNNCLYVIYIWILMKFICKFTYEKFICKFTYEFICPLFWILESRKKRSDTNPYWARQFWVDSFTER